jgi:hypothetical protein
MKHADWRLLVCVLLFLPATAAADGGAIRLSQQRGVYRITVFSTPTPLRAGVVDISVLVQDAVTEKPAADVNVTIAVEWEGHSVTQPATTAAATNKLYHAANFELPEPGWYSVKVTVDGPPGEAQVEFAMEVAEALPSWVTLWPWVGWPVVAIAFFCIHQVLVRRKTR